MFYQNAPYVQGCVVISLSQCNTTYHVSLTHEGGEGSDDSFARHLPPYMCPLRAVVRVNSVPQYGQIAFMALPLFSRWCLSRLLKVLNCRPLHPWSQHCGLGLEGITGTSVVDDSKGWLTGGYDGMAVTIDGTGPTPCGASGERYVS